MSEENNRKKIGARKTINRACDGIFGSFLASICDIDQPARSNVTSAHDELRKTVKPQLNTQG